MATIPPAADAKGLVARLLSFDTMIGSSLIKIIYFVGLALIGLGALLGVLSSLGMMAYSPATGLGSLLLIVLGSAFGVLLWRFSCELWILLFKIHDVLVDIRNRP